MTEVTFGLVTTLPGSGNVFLTGVTDLSFGAGPGETGMGGPILYVTSGPGGGVAAYEMQSGALVLIDRISLPAQSSPGVDSSLALFDMGGDPVALVTGVASSGLWGIGLDGAGELTAQVDLGVTLPADLMACHGVTVAGTDFLYGLRLGSTSISVWKVSATGDLLAVSTPNSGKPASAGPMLTDLTSVEQAGTTFLLAASDSSDALISYAIAPNGVPQEVDRVWAAEGVGISGPSAVVAATVDGQAYAVLAAAGSGTLTVAKVLADGTLAVTDHVMDDLDTRFQGVAVLETIMIDDRAYLVAAGADDGITLLQILPGGRLLDMGSLADSTGTTLNNVSAVALTDVGGDLQIMVTSGSEAGLTWLSVDLGGGGLDLYGVATSETLTGGSGADILNGAAGNDRLSGGSGDDIVMDGAGADVMTGGAGHDTFVLSADDTVDTITDFDPDLDRIDLSGWALLRSPGQLTITTTADGADIRFGDEVLRITTATGSSLQVATVLGLDLLNLSRLDPSWIPAVVPPQTLYGGEGADTLLSSNGSDLLYGNGGADVLNGGYGADRLYGGDGDDRINGQDDNDSLWGDAGNDTLWGEAGVDRIYGGDGADRIDGGDEGDLLAGGAGNDSLVGGNGADNLNGDAGQDRMSGGADSDTLAGNDDNDTLWGDAGDDFLTGDSGDDALYGGTGHDTLQAGAGADTLWGDTDRDRLYGEAGDDRLYGGSEDDLIWAGDGNDMLWGDAGNDMLSGDAGDDLLYGGDGNDSLDGAGGRDRLYGGDGDDTLTGLGDIDTLSGGNGNDVLNGNDGNDLLYGDAGDDHLAGGIGWDTLWGGDGRDQIDANDGFDALNGGAGDDVLFGNAGADALSGDAGVDTLYGGINDDSLFGNDGNDHIFGDNGADRLYGNAGTDTLSGNAGSDRLDGGGGNDVMTGGIGTDVFVFAGGKDRITDFQNDFDTLILDDSLWGGKRLTTAQILDFAAVSGGNIVFDFGGGQTLMIDDMTNTGALQNDLQVI